MALTINTNIRNDADGYLLDAKNVKGGYLVVADSSEMEGLSSAVKVNGTLCYNQADSKFHQWNGSAWVDAHMGSDFDITVLTVVGSSGTFATDVKTALSAHPERFAIRRVMSGSVEMWEYHASDATKATYAYVTVSSNGVVLHSIDVVLSSGAWEEQSNLSYDASDKQDALVSGTNIKTIDGHSILGSGDLPTSPIEVVDSVTIADDSTIIYRSEASAVPAETLLSFIGAT